MRKRLITIGVLASIVAVLILLLSFSKAQPTLISAYFNGRGDDLREVIKQAVLRGQGSVDIALYDFTDQKLKEFLAGIAHSREVRLLLSSEGGGHHYERQICQQLLAVVQAKHLSNMHHKFAVIGSEIVITGSANWTPNSLDVEANNIVVIRDGNISSSYEGEFNRLWGKATAGCP